MMDYGMGWMWGLGWLGMVLFWLIPLVLVLVGIKYLFSGSAAFSGGTSSQRPAQETKSSALAVLEERYAKGEIGRDEFLQKRDDLARK